MCLPIVAMARVVASTLHSCITWFFSTPDITKMSAQVETNGNNDFVLPPRKKPKVSELPLSSAKRTSIDSLLHTFKKKGAFDDVRKKTWAQWEEGSKDKLVKSLETFTDAEIERDAVKYLGKDRRLALPLLEGAAARADVYAGTQQEIEDYISSSMAAAEVMFREIRRMEIGEDAAREEQMLGARSDEDYAADAKVRQQEREAKHKEELKIQKKKETELRKQELMEQMAKHQADILKERARLEREQKRQAERNAFRKREEERKNERQKQIKEEREKKEKEREAEQKKQEEERAARKKKEEEEEAKRLEELATQAILRESQRMQDKPARRERDRSEDAAPPSHREFAPEKRASSLRDPPQEPRRDYRRSPTPPSHRRSSRRDERDRPQTHESRTTRHQEESVAREARLRAISAERRSWQQGQQEKARKERDQADDRVKREPTSVHDAASVHVKRESTSVRDTASVRARSRSPVRVKRERSRSPLPRSDRYRDTRARSRTRSPRRYRDSDYSPPRRRRSRSRSPGGNIDRYMPSSSSRRGAGDRYTGGRDRDDDRYSTRDRGGDRGDDHYSTRDRDRDRSRDRDRVRNHDRDRDYDRDRRRPRDSRAYDEPSAKEIDRYIPTSSRLQDEGQVSIGPSARSGVKRERSRSRSRERDARSVHNIILHY